MAKPKTQAQMEREWRAQSDLDALRRAAEIHADKTRLKAANAEAKKQMNMLQRVTKPQSSGRRGK